MATNLITKGYQRIGSPPPRSPLGGARWSVRSRSIIIAATALSSLLCLVCLSQLGSGTTTIIQVLRPLRQCNPYTQPGYLAYDEADPHANRWHPLTGECGDPAPALAASFLRASWAEARPSKESAVGSEWAHAELGPDGNEWEDVGWAHNRTILYIGDSVSRYKTMYLCQMAGEEMVELNAEHPWSASANGSTSTQTSEHDPFGWHRADVGAEHSHTGHYCYVPGLDFLLVHLHTYGLDQEGFFANMSSNPPPYVFEDRIKLLARPWLDQIRATTGRTSKSPELVYINSALWDVMRWARQDLAAGQSNDASLGRERISWYKGRVRDAIATTAEYFPDASIFWSSTHYPIRPSTGWFFPGVAPHKRPELKMIRLAEMHAAALAAFTDAQDAPPDLRRVLDTVQLIHWGLNMLGQELHQVDDLHHTLLPGGYLWADMALYDLRSVVKGRWL